MNIEKILGMNGTMIAGSKSGYRDKYPKNLVVFNSNICTKTSKIWHGDIDITLSSNKIKELAKELNETVFVLYEMDGRFEHENNPIISKYVYCVDENGKELLGEQAIKYYDIKTLKTK